MPQVVPSACFRLLRPRPPSSAATTAVGNGWCPFSRAIANVLVRVPDRPHRLQAPTRNTSRRSRFPVRRYAFVSTFVTLPAASKTSPQRSPGLVASACWSPDGDCLAAGTNRGTVVIWEIASGKTLRYLRGHTAAVLSVEWHPDGARLASSGADKTVRIWNAHTAETLAVLNAPGEPVGNVHWHPDGKRILAAFAGGVKIWDTTSGKETDSFSIQLGRYVAISPDATRVAYSDRTHCVRDLKSQEIIRSRGPESRRPPVWRPDGKQLASTTDNGPIVIWDAQTGEVVSSILTKADQFSSPAWSPKGRFIAAFCPNRTTKVWDTKRVPPAL